MSSNFQLGFVTVEQKFLENYLKTCNDYYRNTMGDIVSYYHRHDNELFAQTLGDVTNPRVCLMKTLDFTIV